MFEKLSSLNFPVAFHHALLIPQVGWMSVSENLTADGNKLAEAHDFNFNTLKNGEQLQHQLNYHTKRLSRLQKFEGLQPDGHLTENGPELAFKKTFFIQIDPKTRKGRLVMADIDHLQFSNSPTKTEEEEVNKVLEKIVGREPDFF